MTGHDLFGCPLRCGVSNQSADEFGGGALGSVSGP